MYYNVCFKTFSSIYCGPVKNYAESHSGFSGYTISFYLSLACDLKKQGMPSLVTAVA